MIKETVLRITGRVSQAVGLRLLRWGPPSSFCREQSIFLTP